MLIFAFSSLTGNRWQMKSIFKFVSMDQFYPKKIQNFFPNWDEKKFSCDTGQVKSYLFLVRFKNDMWLGLMFVYHTIVDNNMV